MKRAAIVLLNFNDSLLINDVLKLLEKEFNWNCELIVPNFDLQKIFSPEREQYFSTKILEQAIIEYYQFDKILILTDFDLFIPVLTFVFGEAQLNGKSAIVSSHRLHNEFYGLPTDEKVYRSRLIKEIFHEIGHTYGLKHCDDWNCVMHSSSNIDEVDIKSDSFCSKCWRLIEMKF